MKFVFALAISLLCGCSEASVDSDAAHVHDTSDHGCTWVEPGVGGGPCDGMERSYCARWATALAGTSDFTAAASCVAGACLAADHCTPAGVCTCGNEGACPAGSACGVSPGERTPHCLSAALMCAVGCSAAHPTQRDAGPRPTCAYASPPDVFTCDAEGFNQCLAWGQGLSDNASAVTRCTLIPGPQGRCASADRCDLHACRCGSEPECPSGSACLLTESGPSCVACAP